MIEQQLPLEIPPGLFMNGSMMEGAGKWVEGSFVRFPNGIARPMGDFNTINRSGTPSSTGGPAKGMYVWRTDAFGECVVIGRHTNMFVIKNSDGTNSVDDITPTGGLPDEGDINSWSFSNLGEVLLITNAGMPSAAASAPFWVWDPATGAAVSVSTSKYRGVFVTPESFVVLIENEKTLKWASQGTYDVLTPAVGNSAGAIDVPSPHLVVTGRPMVSESLVWTTGDLWAFTYVGGDLIYGLRKVGDSCGILGANSVAVTNGVARWMGQGGFFEYDGYVRPLECPLSEFVFSDIAQTHAHRFFTIDLPQFNSVQFWYMTGVGGDWCDRFVEYNYANGTWTKGDLDRAAGASGWPENYQGSFGAGIGVPIMSGTDGVVLYVHEQMAINGPMAGAYLESGPIHLANGKVVKVQKIIPDSALTGDDISLLAGGFPQENEVQFGPYAVTAGSNIDTRLTARYVRYKQTLESNDSGVGIPRLGIIPGGSSR